jgi:hypothetical protein
MEDISINIYAGIGASWNSSNKVAEGQPALLVINFDAFSLQFSINSVALAPVSLEVLIPVLPLRFSIEGPFVLDTSELEFVFVLLERIQ